MIQYMKSSPPFVPPGNRGGIEGGEVEAKLITDYRYICLPVHKSIDIQKNGVQ